jgi:hypothetical protein
MPFSKAFLKAIKKEKLEHPWATKPILFKIVSDHLKRGE